MKNKLDYNNVTIKIIVDNIRDENTSYYKCVDEDRSIPI